MYSNRILLAESDAIMRSEFAEVLSRGGNEVIQAKDGLEAQQQADMFSFQLVVAELDLPLKGGLDLVEKIKSKTPTTPVILLADSMSAHKVSEAMRAGAYDFREKPINPEWLRTVVQRALATAELAYACTYHRHEQPYLHSLDRFVAESESMKRVLSQAARIAGGDAAVLLTGETGTGKSMVAGAIHYNSARAEKPFVTINCGALPEYLLESELFGHEKGAFPDAYKSRVGRLQQAHGGTVLLDGVGDMPPDLQGKLLRVLENGVFHRIGGSQEVFVDVRIMASAKEDLEQKAAQGGFKKELLYRLNAAHIVIPPLRERKEDIIPLAREFLNRIKMEANRPYLLLAPEAQETLLDHEWPGNIRELKNIMEKAVLFCEGKEILAEDLGLEHTDPGVEEGRNGGRKQGRRSNAYFSAKTLNLQQLEREAIRTALEKSGYVQKKAARLLGLSESQMTYRLNKLSFHHPNFRAKRRRHLSGEMGRLF